MLFHKVLHVKGNSSEARLRKGHYRLGTFEAFVLFKFPVKVGSVNAG